MKAPHRQRVGDEKTVCIRRRTTFLSSIIFLLLCHLLVGASSHATVYLSQDEALRVVFPKTTRVEKTPIALLKKDREAMRKKYGFEIKEKFFDVYVGTIKNQVEGYALILNETGKERPITFLVKITPKGNVERVEIMAFRESHGGEVKNRKFLAQYEAKTIQDPVIVGKDIAAISGATLSSRAISVGVKKALAIIDYFFLKQGP